MSIFDKKNNVPQSIWANPIAFIACGFGVGAIPWIPGTFGTMLGVLFYLFLSQFSLFTYSVIALVLFIFGVMICNATNRRFGTFDHPAIVWDEIVGFLFVMIAIPKMWYFILTGFFYSAYLTFGNPGLLVGLKKILEAVLVLWLTI